MEQNRSTTFNQNILNAIPQDVLDDVPEDKMEEFRRGVLLYLSKEMPKLYQEVRVVKPGVNSFSQRENNFSP